MPISLRFTMDPDPSVIAKKLKEIGKGVKNLKPVWVAARPEMGSLMQRVLDSRGRMIGVNWPPLTKKYRDWKSRKGGRQLLVLSGKLRNSISGRLIKRSKTKGTYVLSRLIYAPVVNWGYKGGDPKRRQWAGWSNPMQEHMRTKVGVYIESILKGISD